MILERLGLRFSDPAMEQRFHEHEIDGRVQEIRLFLALGCVIFAAFGFLDFYVGGEHAEEMLIVRFGFGFPGMVACLYMISRDQFKDYRKYFSIMSVLFPALSIVIMLYFVDGSSRDFYPFGVIAVLYYGTFLVGFKIAYVGAYCLVVGVSYGLAVYINPPSQDAIASGGAFFILGIGTTLIITGLMERETRQRYEAMERQKQARQLAESMLVEARSADFAKSQFLAMISHELRTPLNAVIGFSEIMKDEMLGPLGNERYVEYSNDIHASGSHLLGIINDMLDLTRADMGKFELSDGDFSLVEMVESALKMNSDRAGRNGITLLMRVDLSATDLYIRADERRLRQAVLNLITNSLKFTPRGGEVVTRITLTETKEIQIIVTDTGVGIPADRLDRVLEPFAQVENAFTRQNDGVGLGLPLVKAIVEGHGGRIKIDSTVGVGTKVTITLPTTRLSPLALPGSEHDHATTRRIA